MDIAQRVCGSDGYGVLVDRVSPRGVSRDRAHALGRGNRAADGSGTIRPLTTSSAAAT